MSGIDWMPDEPVPMMPTSLPGEIDAIGRPVGGVIELAPESSSRPGISGTLGTDRQPVAMTTNGARKGAALIGADRPRDPDFHQSGLRSTLVLKLDVPAEVEAVGDVIGITQDIGLRRHSDRGH